MQTNNTPPRTETPVLALAHTKVGICLHYVEECSRQMLQKDYPHDSVMESMELDLLAYRFQKPAPFHSQTLSVPAARQLQGRSPNCWPIVIEYPKEFVYHSEGRAPRLTCKEPQRKAELLVSSTRFLSCGTRIWHLVITPRTDETFSEFDLIKLIHLYDGFTERTDLKDSIRFRLGDTDKESVTADKLPCLLGLTAQDDAMPDAKDGRLELKCGTLQLLIGTQKGTARDTNNPYVSVFDTLRRARKPDGGTASRQIKTWMQQDCEEQRIIMAYCGIVTGIFDFDKIDDEEVLDTLEPTFAGSSAFLRIHRRTLISIAEDDRSMYECRNSVGISPYLILPHATLLYNETLVDRAEKTLDDKALGEEAKLATLEAAHIKADRWLNTLYLPNVFNYVTERSLFEAGSKCRGSNDKRSAVLAKLDELKSHIDIVRERERNHGQFIIKLLLAVIGLFQVKNVIAEIFDWQHQNAHVWAALVIVILMVIAVSVWSYRKGRPRHIANRRSSNT